MRKLYNKLFRGTLLWAILLAAMAGTAGTSAVVVLASGRVAQPLSCNSGCVVDATCRGMDSTCSCSGGSCTSNALVNSVK
jgi:hypothetical protein